MYAHPRQPRAVAPLFAAMILILGCSDDEHASTAPRRAAFPAAPSTALIGCMPNGGRILFQSTIAGDQELYSMREDGGDIRRLTYAVGAERDAVYSPNGSQIAFVATRGIDPRPNIFIMQADGSRPRQLTSAGAFVEIGALTWSPDGERLVFSGRRANVFDVRLDLFSMSSSGSSVTRLTQTPDVSEVDPAYSPLGDRIAFAVMRDSDLPEIWTIAPDGSNRRSMFHCIDTGCRYPAWSPDGLYMAYAETSFTRALRVTPVDGTPSQAWAVASSSIRPTFSPDGTRLVFAIAIGGTPFEIGTVNMDGTNSTQLTSYAVGAYPTSWGR